MEKKIYDHKEMIALCDEAREQGRQSALSDGVIPVAYYCEHKHRCNWPGFHMNRGLAWGKPEDAVPAWRKWHDKECGGKIILVYEKV